MSNGSTMISEGDILSRAIETVDEWNLVARVLSKLTLPKGDLDRVDELLEKNRRGAITEPERVELDKYLRVGNFLDLMKARALRELREPSAA